MSHSGSDVVDGFHTASPEAAQGSDSWLVTRSGCRKYQKKPMRAYEGVVIPKKPVKGPCLSSGSATQNLADKSWSREEVQCGMPGLLLIPAPRRTSRWILTATIDR